MTTITLPRAVAEQALEALEYAQQGRECPSTTRQAITALRAALAQQAEPVEQVATLIAQRDALLEVLKYLDKEFRRHGRQHWPEAVRVGAAIRVRTP